MRYPADSEISKVMPLFSETKHNEHERKWWKEAIVYEIYPASFKDSNDDGIGDIPGIVSELSYLRDLGVDVIAICPHYQSPQVDMGYDISDYEQIHEPYGTIEDVQSLIEATHAHGMRIIFDLVINHSSNLHKWFKESRSSKQSPKRDWYFWRPPRFDAAGNRHPPNNWRSHFTVPAWTWDETTEEYYLHVYAPEMPDFNWENEACRRAIYETSMKFWLERGIDGFRIDTVNKYSKDITFPDAEIKDPGEETQPASKYYSDGPRIHEFLGEMKAIFDQYDIMTVGELSHFSGSEEDVLSYISARGGQLDMVFNFGIVYLGKKTFNHGPLNVPDFKGEISRWQNFVRNPDAWTTIFLENHDQPRSISRFGSESSREGQIMSGKALAMISATMTGTVFLYQGQELGMVNAPQSWPIEEYKDIHSVNYYNQARERFKNDPEALVAAMQKFLKRARDHARLPMQWDGTKNAGFTSAGVTPWMRVHDDWTENNAKAQMSDPDSLLEFWKRILKLRKTHKDLFVYGRYMLLETDDTNLFAFTKETTGMKSVTVVNLSSEKRNWEGLSEILGSDCKLLLGNVEQAEEGVLTAWEGRVYLCGA